MKGKDIQKLINESVTLGLTAKEFDDFVEMHSLTAIYKTATPIDYNPMIKYLIEEANSYTKYDPTDTMIRLYTLMKMPDAYVLVCGDAVNYVLDNLQNIKHYSTEDCYSIADFLSCLCDVRNNILFNKNATLEKINNFYKLLSCYEQQDLIEQMKWWYNDIFSTVDESYTVQGLYSLLNYLNPDWQYVDVKNTGYATYDN